MNYSKLLQSTASEIDNQRSLFDSRVSSLCQLMAKEAAKLFKAKQPKRSIHLLSGMGTAFFMVDGEQVHFDVYYKTVSWDGWKYHIVCGEKAAQVFAPLLDFFVWYDNILTRNESYSDYLTDFEIQ